MAAYFCIVQFFSRKFRPLRKTQETMSLIHRINFIKRKLQTALTTDGMPDTALTTDAKPDPPRIVLEGPIPNSNLSEADIKQKSAPVSPDPQRIGDIVPVIRRPRSASAETTQNPDFPNAENNPGFSESTKPQQRPRSPRTRANKPKSKTAGDALVFFDDRKTGFSNECRFINILIFNLQHRMVPL